MASPISRRPTGLLDLLLTQQQGENPRTLLDSVSPTIDLVKFYESQRLDTSQSSFAVTAVGNSADISIPQAEYWKVIGFDAKWVAGAANQSMGLRFEVGGVASNLLFDFFSQDITRAAIGDVAAYTFMLPQTIIYPSGSFFRFRVTELTLGGAGSISVTITAHYVRMDV